jgi:hypothetical protein
MVSDYIFDIYVNHIIDNLENNSEYKYNRLITLHIEHYINNRIISINVYENYPNSKFYMFYDGDIGFELIDDSTIYLSFDFVEQTYYYNWSEYVDYFKALLKYIPIIYVTYHSNISSVRWRHCGKLKSTTLIK